MSSTSERSDLSRRGLLKTGIAGIVLYSFHLPVAYLGPLHRPHLQRQM